MIFAVCLQFYIYLTYNLIYFLSIIFLTYLIFIGYLDVLMYVPIVYEFLPEINVFVFVYRYVNELRQAFCRIIRETFVLC